MTPSTTAVSSRPLCSVITAAYNSASTIEKTIGVCSQAIEVEVDGDTVKSVQFVGGCNGNTKGIAQLVAGMKVDDVIARLEGTTCGFKPTSCPDQLAKALKEIKAQQ